MAISLRGDRGSFGGALTPPQAGPLRLGALSARAASSALLSVGPNGDVVAGALAAADLPSVFTRRDVAETIAASWTWAAGQTITFAAGPLAIPAAAARSTGTRLIVEPVAASTEYATGRETGALWTSVPSGAAHKWYQGATERLRLDTDGTLRVINGNGTVRLDAAGSGDGGLYAGGSLYLNAQGGAITFATAGGLIAPQTGYRENLGEIHRKYLALHAAELWVETLVAQNTLATIGGRILVGPTTTLTRDVALGDTVVYVKHNALKLGDGTESGSKLLLQAAGKFEVMAVTSTVAPTAEPAGDFKYAVTRALDATGADPWFAGDAVFDTGRATAPAGTFIDLYSVQGVKQGISEGPSIVGMVRTGSHAADVFERWAIGQLKGTYNVGTSTFGAAFGDPDGMHLQIDATNGIRMLGGGASPFLYGQWAMNGDLSLGYSTAGQLTFTASDGALRIKMGGVERFAFLADGFAYLNTGMVAGAGAGTKGIVRSVNATDWNAGTGFYFDATGATPPAGQPANTAHALIGNSAGRRIQWDGASLKLISDGLTIDDQGIFLSPATGAAVDNARSIRWGTTTTLWDSTLAGDARFELQRATGKIMILATESGGAGIVLQAGGSGIDRVSLQLQSVFSGPSQVILGGIAPGGVNYPRFVPATDAVSDLGTTALRWRNLRAVSLFCLAEAIGATTSPPGTYQLELSIDAAGKPTSSTWSVISDARTKTGIEPVNVDAALATVRQVPIIRYRSRATDAPGIGVVAQDVAALLPLSVRARPDGLLDWNAHELFTLTVAAVQALALRLDALERTSP